MCSTATGTVDAHPGQRGSTPAVATADDRPSRSTASGLKCAVVAMAQTNHPRPSSASSRQRAHSVAGRGTQTRLPAADRLAADSSPMSGPPAQASTAAADRYAGKWRPPVRPEQHSRVDRRQDLVSRNYRGSSWKPDWPGSERPRVARLLEPLRAFCAIKGRNR